ncbi:MAG: sulfatase [Verrucomicrobia bacterium]|nr:sulfatase [Verrucomicrobiota bacterium]MDA1087511.1 sulfatase [Verrucomicrobiota bacterium]
MSKKQPNILLIAIDSLRRDHMSCYGYPCLTTPFIDEFAENATLFEETISAHIPTTSAYASMLTGRDCFGTEVVALRHQGPLTKKVRTLPEILRRRGYKSLCVGFTGNPSARGFDKYLDYDEVWGSWEERPLRKAERLNDVAIPALEQLSKGKDPWFVMLRHMDPHAPYLPPAPYDGMFFQGDPCDPRNKSMDPVRKFKPFRDFLLSWMPPGVTDKEHPIAQYDGAVAYMDACIQNIFTKLESLGILDDTIVVLNGDHGETLYDHECWFDHHGLYDPTLVVPLIIRYPSRLPAGLRVGGLNQHKDLVPTLLDLAGISSRSDFDGQSLMKLVNLERACLDSEIYITECTWMRKHGWRTPEWKLIEALEPDIHFKPKVELYNLVQDPAEDHNVAKQNPEIVRTLTKRMNAFIARREKETGIKNPMLTQGDWHGQKGVGAFKTSRQAYNTLHIGSAAQAKTLQEKSRKK